MLVAQSINYGMQHCTGIGVSRAMVIIMCGARTIRRHKTSKVERRTTNAHAQHTLPLPGPFREEKKKKDFC